MIVRPKINLFLEITARRPDGFHEIATVMQTVDNLTDTLEAEAAGELSLETEDLRAPVPESRAGGAVSPGGAFPPLPTDERNLVLRAALALRERAGTRQGARFRLVKRVPDGAGLGGGSADAAAALTLLNRLWRLDLPVAELAEVAAATGSDTAFFLYDGATALCTGRGERVRPLPGVPPLAVTLVIPPWRSATAAAYRALDPADFGRHPAEGFLDILRRSSGTPEAVAAAAFNLFEDAIARQEPRQTALQARLKNAGFPARLSGSGSCLWTPAMPAPVRERLQRELDADPLLGGTRLA